MYGYEHVRYTLYRRRLLYYIHTYYRFGKSDLRARLEGERRKEKKKLVLARKKRRKRGKLENRDRKAELISFLHVSPSIEASYGVISSLHIERLRISIYYSILVSP